MTNVKFEVEEDKLTIEVDLSEEHGKSKSGKTVTIASTKGNIQVAPGVWVGLNVYKYPGA